MKTLTLEIREQGNETATFGMVSLAPAVNEGYWAYRVQLSDTQAVLGFPKFSTIGIGFAVESDWNTNLPYTCDAQMIANHIAHNKGDDCISDDDVLTAIVLIQAVATKDRVTS